MRIETWDLKVGDPITVRYFSNGKNKYVGYIIDTPYEQANTLFIKWEGQHIINNRYTPDQYRGVAYYHEDTNRWLVHTKMIMEE